MSKRVFHHPPESETGRKYWRSLGQLENRPEFREWLEREFPQGAAEFKGGEVSRRNFLQLMGASAALAGLSLASCRRELKHLVPFTKGVEWSIPGKALFFATSMPTRRGAQPLVVATYDGRPTKVEGNPLHPAVKGASTTWAQSSILDLYDPDRSRDFLHMGEKSDEASFIKALEEILAKAGDGSGIAFLVERNASPTRERLRAEIEKKYPKVSWSVYEPAGGVAADAARVAFGEGMLTIPQIEKADVIMAVDSDFLGNAEGDVEGIRQFTARRKVDGPESRMNRLYVVESHYTVTGTMADHRLRVAASQTTAFLVALADQIGKATNDAILNGLVQAVHASNPFNAEWVKQSAADLIANKGRSLVLVGERQSVLAQVIGHAINAALGNLGKTVLGRREIAKPARKIEDLAADIEAKKVQTLFILGGNPVYNAPADLQWVKKQGLVPTVIRLGLHEDETTKSEETTDIESRPRVKWHVPVAHYLEAWGDGLASDGSYTSTQPMILPLYGGWSEVDLLAVIAGQKKPGGPELVQETFRAIAKPSDFTAEWSKFLHDGFLDKSAAKAEALTLNGSAVAQYSVKNAALPAIEDDKYEVIFATDNKLDDGRHANNGWLQELPDPITKQTWDNAALISPKLAKELAKNAGLEDPVGQYDRHMFVNKIEIQLSEKDGGGKISLPALISPGAADNSIRITLGYGRTVVGRVGRGMADGGTGFNAYPLRTTANSYFATGATVSVTEERYTVAVTQEHGTLEGRGADFTREANFEKYKVVAAAAEGSEEKEYFKKMGMDSHTPPNISLYGHPELTDPHQWAMTVDLNTCTGCSACMIACQSENNIPIVGKDQVLDNREMHWMRTDRYFASENDDMTDPEVVSQPLMCQHCEYAPCETVCPVNATVHSDDGVNVMAYNRCIGTRYCANNCPFKVRRFNFFDYNQRDVLGHKTGHPFSGLYKWNLLQDKGTAETLKMQKNPNVTVRMRGVMEKCTFCIQRIQEAKIAAKVHSRDSDAVPKVPANAFTSACAQVCPTSSITFGDKNNPDSDVSRVLKSERGYRLLEYLNVSPRVTYLARVRNPNPKMPDYSKLGSFIENSRESHKEATPNGGNA